MQGTPSKNPNNKSGYRETDAADAWKRLSCFWQQR
jgi:hypothetical protein